MYLVIAICFLSIFYCAIPVYAASPVPNWQAIYTVDSSQDAKIIGDFKSTEAMQLYHSLSESEKRLVDLQYYASMVDTYGDTNFEPGNNIKSQIENTVISILSVAGITYAGFKDFSDYLGIHKKIAETSQKSGGLKKSLGLSDTATINGKINVSKDFINELRFSVAEFYNCLVYAPLPSTPKEFYTFFTLDDPYKTRYEKSFNESFNMGRRAVVVYKQASGSYSNASYSFRFLKSEDYIKNCIFYLNTNYLSCFETLDVSSSIYPVSESAFDVDLNPSYGNTFGGAGSNKIPVNGNYTILGVTGMPFVVFKTKDAALAHLKNLNGSETSNYYISTEIVNNDYSTTVNKIYNYANGGYTDVIQGQIDKAITDKGSGLTDEEYQKIINDVTKQLQEKIDKDDSGNTGGGSGGDSGNTGGGSGGDSGNTGGGESNTWLEKIYNRLGDILEKIGTVTGVDTLVSLVQQIADDIKTLKEGGTLSSDLSDTNGFLKDIKKLLGTLIAVQAAGDVADLLTDTVGDKISDFVDNLKSGVSEVTDALQDVFPFSIPWDLMAILALFSAEPQVPVFDIPVNIPQLGVQHKIHVDLSDFESISVICRAFLSLSFAVGLMYLTIRITGGKDDD